VVVGEAPAADGAEAALVAAEAEGGSAEALAAAVVLAGAAPVEAGSWTGIAACLISTNHDCLLRLKDFC
jgi:hypothetical protein